MMFKSLKDVEVKFLEMEENSKQARQDFTKLRNKVVEVQKKLTSQDSLLKQMVEGQARLEQLLKQYLGLVDSDDIPMERSDEFACKSLGAVHQNQEQNISIDCTSSRTELGSIEKHLDESMSQLIPGTPKSTLQTDIKDAGEDISRGNQSNSVGSTPCVRIQGDSALSSGQFHIHSAGANRNGLFHGNIYLNVFDFSKTGIANIVQLSPFLRNKWIISLVDNNVDGFRVIVAGSRIYHVCFDPGISHPCLLEYDVVLVVVKAKDFFAIGPKLVSVRCSLISYLIGIEELIVNHQGRNLFALKGGIYTVIIISLLVASFCLSLNMVIYGGSFSGVFYFVFSTQWNYARNTDLNAPSGSVVVGLIICRVGRLQSWHAIVVGYVTNCHVFLLGWYKYEVRLISSKGRVSVSTIVSITRASTVGKYISRQTLFLQSYTVYKKIDKIIIMINLLVIVVTAMRSCDLESTSSVEETVTTWVVGVFSLGVQAVQRKFALNAISISVLALQNTINFQVLLLVYARACSSAVLHTQASVMLTSLAHIHVSAEPFNRVEPVFRNHFFPVSLVHISLWVDLIAEMTSHNDFLFDILSVSNQTSVESKSSIDVLTMLQVLIRSTLECYMLNGRLSLQILTFFTPEYFVTVTEISALLLVCGRSLVTEVNWSSDVSPYPVYASSLHNLYSCLIQGYFSAKLPTNNLYVEISIVERNSASWELGPRVPIFHIRHYEGFKAVRELTPGLSNKELFSNILQDGCSSAGLSVSVVATVVVDTDTVVQGFPRLCRLQQVSYYNVSSVGGISRNITCSNLSNLPPALICALLITMCLEFDADHICKLMDWLSYWSGVQGSKLEMQGRLLIGPVHVVQQVVSLLYWRFLNGFTSIAEFIQRKRVHIGPTFNYVKKSYIILECKSASHFCSKLLSYNVNWKEPALNNICATKNCWR